MSALGSPRKIVVFRALQLGDLLCAIPALRALKHAHPSAQVTLVGLPWTVDLIRRFPSYLDDFMPFPGFPGFPERDCDVEGIPRFLQAAQERHFDLALQLHGSGRLSNPLVMMFGAHHTAGFFRPGEYCPDQDRFVPWRDEDHEIQRYLLLMQELGVPSCGTTLEFPLMDQDRLELDKNDVGRILRSSPYVCVHPGAQLPSRRWRAERFAHVADALADRGYLIVLTGTANETDLTHRVARAMRRPAIDLAGETTLGAVAALIDGAHLLISNDTGVAHLAAARQTPSVIVSSGGEVDRWAPLDPRLHRVLHHEVECRPCAYSVCPIGHPCADGVTSEAVIAAANALLAEHADVTQIGRASVCVH